MSHKYYSDEDYSPEVFKMIDIAVDILDAIRNTVLMKYRYLEYALFKLRPVYKEGIELSADGKELFFDAKYVINRYHDDKAGFEREYLHMLLHCIFQHPFLALNHKPEIWAIASDIVVEGALMDIEIKTLDFSNNSKAKHDVISYVLNKVKGISANAIYDFIEETYSNGDTILGYGLKDIYDMLHSDNHDSWYKQYVIKESADGYGVPMSDEEINNSPQISRDKSSGSGDNENENESEGSKDSNDGQGGSGDSKDSDDSNSEDSNSEDSNSDGSNSNDSNSDSNSNNQERDNQNEMKKWKVIAEKVMTDKQMNDKKRGTTPGNFTKALQSISRDKYDYTEFLKKFSKMEERMQVNEDEYDYVYYTYGLRLFDNMPLIEPLEYKESYQITDFVIAIDTSGSTIFDNLIKKFLTKTYSILKQSESFSKKVNIHIIQCDAEIQEDKVITNEKELDEYIKNFKIKGMGGTDFRPVFEYVDKLMKKGELKKLRGLLYFTDGYGTFPVKPTPYKTAFVFVDEGADVQVPSWAMKVFLEKGDFKDGH